MPAPSLEVDDSRFHYVSTLRRKLGEALIETVRGSGYRLGQMEPGR